jgi:hypothetical protein
MTSCPHGNPLPGQVDALDRWRRQRTYRLDTAQPRGPVVVLTISEVVEDEQALITPSTARASPPGRSWWSWSVGQMAAVCCR